MLSDEAKAFLSERRFAVLGTINSDGTPQLSTMWYILEGDEILMNTKAGRIKDRNIHRDPRVSLCIEDEYHYITLNGVARLIDDQEVAQADIHRLAVYYNGAEVAQKQMDTMFSKERRITIRVKIERAFERL